MNSMPYDVQIRPELIKAGYTDSDIGYDEGRKMTTLKGQDFLGANDYKNVAGSTFAERQTFDKALNKFKQGEQLADVQAKAFNSTPYTNPYDQRIDQLFNQFQSQVQNPTQVDPYGTPQYAAAQAQMAKQAQQGIRSAQESLGSAGFGRSTALGESAQRVQNDADAYLQTQILPQIVQQLQAEEQRKTQGLYQLLNSLMGQQGVYDTRNVNERNVALDQLDYLTGRSDRAQDIQREDANMAEERAYRDVRDSIADERYKLEFDEDTRRYGLDYALRKAEANNQMANRNAQTSLDRERLDLQRRELDIREKEAYARTAEENASLFQEESRALTEALRSGEISATDALKQIDEDLSFGFYTPEQAEKLKEIVAFLSPSLPSSQMRELTDEEQVNMPSEKELDKLYEQTGKPKGYARIDWKQWYRDPRGRIGGVDFETWKSLHGPKLTGR
jgi:hypothetical protein